MAGADSSPHVVAAVGSMELNDGRGGRLAVWLPAIVTLFTIAVAWWWIRHTAANIDEDAHVRQTTLFIRGEWRMYVVDGNVYPFLAMIPGYHVAAAGIGWLFGLYGYDGVRWTTLLMSLGLWFAAYSTARNNGSPQPALRAWQTYCCPLVFPFCFLAYTDVPSLALNLTVLSACLRGRFVGGGLTAIVSLLVRQTNIVFTLLAPLFDWHRLDVAMPAPRVVKWRRSAFFLFATALFMAFVIANGRVSLCHPHWQRTGLFGLNLLFSAACGALVFAPWLVARCSATLVELRRCPAGYAAAAGVVVAASLLVTSNDTRNTTALMPELLRNYVLEAILATTGGRLLAAAFAMSFLFTVVAAVPSPSLVFLAALWLGTLAPVELVEPRYYMPAYACLVLLRPAESLRSELVLWAWFLCGGLALHRVHAVTDYFA